MRIFALDAQPFSFATAVLAAALVAALIGGCARTPQQTVPRATLPPAPADTTPMMSMEVRVEGNVQVLSEHGEGLGAWRVLRPGPQNLFQGDTLATGRTGSSATLTFAGGTVMRMGELTELRSTGLTRSGDRVRFELTTGTLEAMLAASVVSFDMATPTATLSDASGHWAVEHRDGSMVVAVRDGSVAVQPLSGPRRQAVVVDAGQKVLVSRGQPIAAPESIDADTANRLFASRQ
jgi:ferric-dicitrate binding protein FerR (iron transport regulator)